MSEHKRLVENIQSRMAFYVANLRISNDRDYFDENKEAEYFFCKPLSLLFDANVTNVNSEQRNFPGIDLADRKESICFQITSTNTKKKVQHTLDEFLSHDLDEDFDRLIVLIVTTDDPPKCANLTLKRPFDFDVRRDVWNISRLVQEFENLPFDKRHLLQAFSDYLDQELPAIETRKPHLELPLYSTLPATGFVGRQPELAEIRSRFDAGDALVVLTGLGGMGKTELAVQYGRQHLGQVYFTRFDTSFTRTLANMAQGIRPALSDEQLRQDEKTLCALVLNMLEASDKTDLLIIDNADSPTGTLASLQKDPCYQALCKLPLKLLLTTRSAAPRAIPIDPMPEDPLFDIFRIHGADLDEADMRALIDAVDSHTLTIDLIARTLNGGGLRKVTAEMMLKALEEDTLADEKYRKIATDYNQSTEEARIYQHLSTVFDMSDMSDIHRHLLCIATLFPDNGIYGDLIARIMTDDTIDQLEMLISLGWLGKKGDLLTIHPVIRLVCREELKPSDEACDDFLYALWTINKPTEYNRVISGQLAEVYIQAVDHLEDAEGTHITRGCSLLIDIAQYDAARALYDQHLPAMEKRLKDHPTLAAAYNHLGIIHGALGSLRKSLEFQLKALDLLKRIAPDDLEAISASLSSAGLIYHDLGDHQNGLKFTLEALHILEQYPDDNGPALASAYNNVSLSYHHLGKGSKSLEFALKSVEIEEQILSKDHPNLAASYTNVGNAYGRLCNCQKSLEYHKKAMTIWEQLEDYACLAYTYFNIGGAYADSGNLPKALEFRQKSLQLRKEILPANHPKLASSYNGVGYIYLRMGQPEEALPLLRQALAIWRKELPDDHPDIEDVRTGIRMCESSIRMKQNLARAGVDLTKPFGQMPMMPPFKK